MRTLWGFGHRPELKPKQRHLALLSGPAQTGWEVLLSYAVVLVAVDAS